MPDPYTPVTRFPVLGSLLMAGALFLSPIAMGHEYWIEPSVFHAARGQPVSLTLRVGQEFTGVSIQFLPNEFVRFYRHGPDGERDIQGVLGDDPAGRFSPGTDGHHVVALVTRPNSVTFDTGDEFERYLVKEGLEHHLELHRSRFKPGQTILETYYRCAKTLVQVGTRLPGPPDRTLGLPLELVAEAMPEKTPRTVRLRLDHQGKPLAGARVLFINKAEPGKKFTVRTDTSGKVSVVLPRPGVWLANSVYMQRAPFYAKEDWNSIWASLTFEVR